MGSFKTDYLKENMKVKCEFIMQDENGQRITRICSLRELGELSSYERENLSALVLFPMKKAGYVSQFPEISNLIEGFVRDFPNLRRLAVTHQFTKLNLATIRRNGCPSLSRCVVIRDTKDRQERDVIIGAKKIVHNKEFSDSDNNYFCQLTSDDKNECEIVDVYDYYEFPRESKAKRVEETETLASTDIVSLFDEKQSEIKAVLAEENIHDLDFEREKEVLIKLFPSLTPEQREIVRNALERINVNIDKSVLEDALPEFVEEIPSLIAAPETTKEEFVEELVRELQGAEEGSDLDSRLGEGLTRILLCDNKLFYKYLIDKSVLSEEDALRNARTNINNNASGLYNDINACYVRMGITGENKEKIDKLLGDYVAEHGADLQKRVLDSIVSTPTADKITDIVERSLAKSKVELSENQQLQLTNSIADAVVAKYGDMAHLTDDDLVDIGQVVISKLSTLDIDHLHKSVAEIKQEIGALVSLAQIEEKFNNLDGRLAEASERSDSRLASVASDIADLKGLVQGLYDIAKEKNLDTEAIESLFNSRFGALLQAISQSNSTTLDEVQKIATNINATNTNIEQTSTKIESNISNITQLINTLNNNFTGGNVSNQTNITNICQNVVQAYLAYQAIANAMSVNYQSLMGANGNVSPLMANSISNVLMLSMLGLGVNQGMQYAPANNMQQMVNFIDALQKMYNGYINMQGGTVTPTPAPTPKPTPASTSIPAPKKPTPAPAKPTKVIAPKKTKVVSFIEKSSKELDKLIEPKKKAKLLQRIARHPIKSAIAFGAIGAVLGGGAFVLANIATLASGVGFGAIVSAMASGVGTSALAGVGVGAVTSGVLSGVGSVLKTVRRERLYNKFQKKYKKAMKYSAKLQRDAIKVAQAEDQKEDLRVALRSASNDKQRNKALKALAKKRKRIRKLKNKEIKHTTKYTTKAHKALDVKDKLNDLENATGKTNALAGTLQYLRNKKVKMNSEDYSDLKESVEEEISDLTGVADVDADVVESTHKTYDAEAVNLIKTLEEMKRSNKMNDTLDEIRSRHTVHKAETKQVEQYDINDIRALQAEVANNPTLENQKILQDVLDEYNAIQAEINSHTPPTP